MNERPIPIVIDTDFGGDPDDAVALSYALACPELEIRAIISADEYQSDHRARALTSFLQASGKSIPVFAGADLGNTRLFFLEKDVDRRLTINALTPTQSIKPILAKLAQDQGQYLSIGGLTNLAKLHHDFPELIKQLKITIMGGAIHYRKPGMAEHNVRLDLSAARTIFNSDLNTSWVLSDHTFVEELKVQKGHALYTYFASSEKPSNQMVHRNLDNFFEKLFPDSRLHDPLAVSSVFLPTVKFERKSLQFSEKGEFNESDTGRAIKVSQSVDYSQFWTDITSKFGIK